MNNVKTDIVQTDGSNGYQEGTWEWRVHGVYSDGRTWMHCDGGWPSRDAADAAMRRWLKKGC